MEEERVNQDQDNPNEPQETPPNPTWRDELAKLDPQEFKKIINEYPALSGVIGGIIGTERQRAIELYEARRSKESTEQRRVESDAELIKLLEDNEDLVKQYYPKVHERLTELQQSRAEKELRDVQDKSIRQIGLAIGRALADVPEWNEVPNERKQELATLMQGRSDEEALAVFNHYAWQLVADVRAEKRVSKFRTEELEKERAAIRQEEAAKLMRSSDAPDLRKPSGSPAKVNLRDMSDTEFDHYWNTVVKK